LTVSDDSVLQAERAHIELAARCLARMRADAEHIADYGVDELASHGLGQMRAQRLAALSADPGAPPFFGRIDRSAEVFHIGRRHVRDEHGDPVVIDWRAPIARAFYRATPAEPMDVRLRRRFGFDATGLLSSYEDERLAQGQALGLRSGLLREEIERPRVGPMRDIVATIQPDQDELVRADVAESVCVQGAPGTGKTAVGLHRAAYLLYTYPARLRRSGVLVVGPNAAFLHYISQVLPSLGEAGIEQCTLAELVGADGVSAPEPSELAVLKGDARMADVLQRAVLAHVAKPADDVVAVVDTKRYRIGAHHLRRYVDDARRALRAGSPWTVLRERLRQQVAEDVRRQREDAGSAPSDAETARVARSAAVGEFLDATWPVLRAQQVLARLYTDEQFLQRCAPALAAEEVARLLRPAGAAWTAADAVLLDELHGLLEGTATYVHVVADEAQDLSAMQCRAIGRRCPSGSITVLGDLAQATTPWAPGEWAQTLRHLGHPGARVQPLTTGYRVPGTVLQLANRLLPHIAPGLAPASSVRAGTDALRFAPAGDLAPETRRALAAAGSVGVIVPDARASAVLAELTRAGIAARAVEVDRDARVSVVATSVAKGLEFDSVLVLEPEQIVSSEPARAAGLRLLYVALTRAVSRLSVLHDAPLPPELAG
jgi:DNA helicase IV